MTTPRVTVQAVLIASYASNMNKDQADEAASKWLSVYVANPGLDPT